MKRAVLSLLALLMMCAVSPGWAAETPLPADGTTDATAAIQARLDELGTKGGELFLPAGQYLIAGSLHVPPGVCLRGSWDAPHHGSMWQLGTTLLITGGRGQEHGPSAIRLSGNSALEGVTMLWPEQTWNNIQPYPWAIEGEETHATVDNVTLVNAYQGIWIGSRNGSLHLIRNVYGCVLCRGIFIDKCSDIGRIENVHFNPHYWLESNHPSSSAGATAVAAPKPGAKPSRPENVKTVRKFMFAHLDSFIFGRSDWEYVMNTFTIGAQIGYRFIKTASGECNGQFMGIGADNCDACVQIDAMQGIGLQITNGEFTSFSGDPNTAIVTAPGCKGAAQLVNCNFWGIKNHVLWMQGDAAVTLADCHMVNTPASGDILAENGRLVVQGCNFATGGPAVILKPGVKTALITGNLQTGGLQVQNEIGSRAQIGLNETSDDAAGAGPGPTSR